MVTYFDTKMIKTCLPMIGMFFDTIIVASTDKEPIMTHQIGKCCKLLPDLMKLSRGTLGYFGHVQNYI